ncbi:MAG: flavodoxin family protein [Fidelibacterota bacterium]|nr:MAG: flavodoxin family protein [Candidatus Neomarinimicrobiota bacterium]
MNTLIVHFSKFGNTQLVAGAIAEALETTGSVRVTSLEQLTPSDLAAVDLVVAGTPTHRMNMPEAIRPVFEALPKHVLRATPVAAFDTSYRMSALLSRFTAAKKLARKFRRLGGKIVVPPETFHVEGREGPLFEGELERAREWAGAILERMPVPRTDGTEMVRSSK